MNRRSDLLSYPLLNHRFPWHQRESQAIVQHGKTPTGEHHATPVDAGHALAVGHRAMLQAGVVRNVLRGLRQLPIAQGGPQVPSQRKRILPAATLN